MATSSEEIRTRYGPWLEMAQKEQSDDLYGRALRDIAFLLAEREELLDALKAEIRDRFPRTIMSDAEVREYLESEYGVGGKR
ncbi:MAG TPA: hypothetical protein VIL85_02955 [Thermomicrobiales bacterium]|jgi:hypothetical protein